MTQISALIRYFDHVTLPVAVPQLRHGFILDAGQIGLLFPVGSIASVVILNIAVATRNFVILEQLSERLGIEINLDEVAKYPLGQESIAVREAIYAPNETVGHW